jgi:hypothetical protein
MSCAGSPAREMPAAAGDSNGPACPGAAGRFPAWPALGGTRCRPTTCGYVVVHSPFTY